jgi:hypothetical protein
MASVRVVASRWTLVLPFVASCGGSTTSQGRIGDRHDASVDSGGTGPDAHVASECRPDAAIQRNARSIDAAATACAGFAPYEVGVVSAVSDNCALRTDGSVTCWYEDWEGSFLQISGVCGVRSDHTVQCRDGGVSPAGSFVQVAGESRIKCAIESGGPIRCWTLDPDLLPLEPPVPSDRVSDIDVMSDHACAIRTDGTLSCWTYQECTGDGGWRGPFAAACPVPWCNARECAIPAGAFTDVTLGDGFACAVAVAGEISCWATSPGTHVPTPPAGKFRRIEAESAVCAVGVDGHVECFNDPNARLSAVPATVVNARDVAVGSDHACAVTDQGKVRCWPGGGWQGSKPFTALAVGRAMGPCALDTDGALRCRNANPEFLRGGPFGVLAGGEAGSGIGWVMFVCGFTRSGQVSCVGFSLGAGSFYGICDFATPGPSTSATVGSMAASGGTVCTLDDCGYLSCSQVLGACSAGQQPSSDRPLPGRFSQISAGLSTFCGLSSTGSVECWGDITSIGAHRDGPYREVSVGSADFACALRVDGELDCWGDKIPPGVSPCRFESIAAGDSFVCGLQSDGQPVCWGGGAIAARTPRGPFVAIASGGMEACGIRPTGSIECWGQLAGGGSIPAGWY